MKLNTIQRKRYRVSNKVKNVSGSDRFRLTLSRTSKNISAQIIDDAKNITLLSASSVEKDIKSMKKINKTELSKIVAEKLAKKAQQKKITKISFGLACSTLMMSAVANEQKQPNILFVFADDHATHSISAYGSTINETPNIDKLANEGMLFRSAFATNSICGPSRAVILTGKHSHKNGFMNNEWGGDFDGSQQTFPKLLQKAGYQTSLIGKWHLYSEPTGFDHWEILPGQGRYYNPRFKSETGTVEVTGYTTDVITDRALDWLDKRDKNKPFMLMYQHKAPHREWAPGPDHIDNIKILKLKSQQRFLMIIKVVRHH